jgi:glucose dehydrogenase
VPNRGLLPLALWLACAPPPVAAQEWPHPGNDPGGTRHSSLAQIDRSNVARLGVAWTFDTGDWSDGSVLPSRSALEATPLVIDGVLYVPPHQPALRPRRRDRSGLGLTRRSTPRFRGTM